MVESLLSFDIIASFITLTALEIVLGVDNLILISILTDRLPKSQQPLARKLGIGGAVVTRILLLSLVFFIATVQMPLFTLMDLEFGVREILLIIGGIFLLGKGTVEIHHKIEGAGGEPAHQPAKALMWVVITQIMVMDIVFSFDSVLTAVGVADHLPVMISAILVSVLFMLLLMEQVHGFISRHPTVKVLALSYMLLIGMALIAEGFHAEIPKGYLYFAMAFSFGVEVINMVVRSRAAKVAVIHRHPHEGAGGHV